MKINRKIIAIIPVRKGSVRLKDKNFLKFEKKSLTEITIDCAKRSKIFTKIIVSTDNQKLEKICKSKKVDFFYRKNFCDNNSPVSYATHETILKMKLEKNDIIVQLMATCPLRTPEDILNSINFFLQQKKNFQISVFRCGWIKDNYYILDDGKKSRLIKKILNNKFYPTGSVWIANIKEFLKSKNFYGKNFGIFELPWIRSIDIDTEDDFKTALLLKKYLI